MDKSQKFKKLSLNTILFTISGFGSKIISFLLVPLYTYMLSTEEYGNLDLMSTTAQLMIPILTLNIQDAVLRFALDKECDNKKVINVALKIFGVGSIIMLGLVVLFDRLQLFSLDSTYIWYLFALYLTSSLYNILSMYLRAIDKIKLLVISGLLNTIITCGLNILLLLVLKLGIGGYMCANVAGSFVAIVLMFFFGGIFKTFRQKETLSLFIKMASYSLPLVANSLAWWVNNASDRYILTFFCGATINGIYAVSYKIPTILSTVQGIFNSSWSISAITEFDKDDKDGFLGNVYTMYSCISFIGCSVIMIFNIYLAKILYSNDFYQAWQSVPFLLLGTVFNGLALFEGHLFGAVKKTKAVSYTTFAGAAINTIMNFALIPFIGAVGAAAATCLGYFATWTVRTIQMKKIVSMKVKWNYQITCLFLLFLQSIIATIYGKFYYQVIFFAVITFVLRKDLMKVISKIRMKTQK